MQFKYNDIPMMKGTYHISQNGTMLSFDLKGENSTFEHVTTQHPYRKLLVNKA